MKILAFPHDLGIGGSQINAIDIAAALQRRGHSLLVFGRSGALNEHIDRMGLEFIEAPRPRHRPTPAITRALAKLVTERRIQVLHGYEWPPALECALAARTTSAVAVSTVMSMSVAPFIPKRMPMLVGTAEILATEQKTGRFRAALLEPPVDLEHNNPSIDVGVDDFRRRWGLTQESFVVVVVTRLAVELKLEGLLAAIKAVNVLARELPVTLLIVGDGAAREQVEADAAAANASSGRRSVIIAGQMTDPRAAYAVADVVLGMGSSALRALAFAKPLIVQGEKGFWELLTPESLPLFLHQGWFGVGPGVEHGTAKLIGLLRALIADADRRRALSDFSLKTVEDRFSLAHAADLQERFYEKALAEPSRPTVADDAAAGGKFIAHQLARRARQLVGSVAIDDFNSDVSQRLRSAPGLPLVETRR